MRAYANAISKELGNLMKQVEDNEEVINNDDLEEGHQAFSNQLYFVLCFYCMSLENYLIFKHTHVECSFNSHVSLLQVCMSSLGVTNYPSGHQALIQMIEL